MFEQKELGTCPFCGSKLIETQYGWGCSNYRGGCKAFIYRNDNFFEKVLGTKIRKNVAVRLLKGETVRLYDVVIHGKKHTIDLSWGKKEEGSKYPFGYKMVFVGEEKKKNPNEMTAFDILNG